ncbi:NUDIX domain-containing protein [Phyllobacterium sp. YR531]|uniref:NUDIX hydrolase n=1 Tax=Phyllobacterium sp. YR531 TaxID=1144343 RepID=UPI00026F86C7|nr:NUDIX domain-containing protein [Phyllobacterium sp. YR531]EJN05251.1 NUDIX family protein [Phyllobacterium sp. YR531]
MDVYRPQASVRAKAIGLVWKADKFLAFEVENGDGEVDGVRPFGGLIKTGETKENALEREFLEELGSPIKIVGPWHDFESKEYSGQEHLFVTTVELMDKSYYAREEIIHREAGDTTCWAKWYDPLELKAANLKLYPAGLDTILSNRREHSYHE